MINEAFKIALGQYGNTGIYGPKSDAEILKYYHDIGFTNIQDDDIAWCAGFMNWCLMGAGKDYYKSLHARDFLNYGTETDKPEIGDIVVFWRISKDSIYGHVAFFVAEHNNLIYVLGGNQQDSVNISPFSKTQVLSYRKIA